MKRIVIFASGSGTNAENLIRFFHNSDNASVIQVLCNNPHAKVLDRAKNLKVSSLCFNRVAFSKTDDVLNILKASNPDLIVLAGFLWKFPEFILNEFPNKVINVHPALLPKFGGKGMYGMNVHKAVVDNNETETGITIHYVNENYDEGAIIFQAKCDVLPNDTAEDVAVKIHELEMAHFPGVVDKLFKINLMDEFIIEPCKKENRNTILDGINHYNLSKVPVVSDIWTPLEYVVRSNDGVVIAGLLGGIGYWSGLEIKILWVEKSYRNQGVGSKILKYTEKIAKEKGAHISMVDTFDFQVEDFYLKNGYKPFSELKGFPTENSRRIYFSKKLNE